MNMDSIVGGDKGKKSAKTERGRHSCQEEQNLEVSAGTHIQ